MKAYLFLCVVIALLSLIDYFLLPGRGNELNPILRRFYSQAGGIKAVTLIIFVVCAFFLSFPRREYIMAFVASCYFYAVLISFLVRIRA